MQMFGHFNECYTLKNLLNNIQGRWIRPVFTTFWKITSLPLVFQVYITQFFWEKDFKILSLSRQTSSSFWVKISSSRFDIEDGCFHQKNPKIPNLLPRSNVRYSKKSFTLTTFKMYISKGQNQVLFWYVVVG